MTNREIRWICPKCKRHNTYSGGITDSCDNNTCHVVVRFGEVTGAFISVAHWREVNNDSRKA